MPVTAAPRRVSNRFLMLVHDFLEDRGAGTDRLAQVSGVSADILGAHTSFLTDFEFQRYVGAVTDLTNREDLGFEIGRRVRMNSNGPLGYGLLSSTRLHDFMGMLSRHYHLVNSIWTMSYRRHYSGGEVVYLPCTAPSRAVLNFSMEAIATAHQNQIHLMLGGVVPTYDIHISMPRPEHFHRYAELAPARFHFHEDALPSVRVVMGSAMLDIPLALGDPVVMREVEERCNTMGSQHLRTEVSWADHVTMLLREAPTSQLTLEKLAKHVNVSARTIDRHLRNEGVGFRELSDKARFERACSLLSSGGSSVVGVAEQLGFSDAANFSRAFKRVLGVSPSDYQRGDR